MSAASPIPLASKIAAVLPYALPVLGGTIGIFYVNATPNASPVLWIATGALLGGVLARFLVKPLESFAAKQRLKGKTNREAE
ncbi:hypothetical protein [Roseovarius sp. 2305UL8-3]|uniref:hypothetical protein n=1 Tax=Roseovarius conchicola TaxID=3121636 RepID=UPI00352989F5